MVPINLTYLHCLQHSLFEYLFNLYLFVIIVNYIKLLQSESFILYLNYLTGSNLHLISSFCYEEEECACFKKYNEVNDKKAYLIVLNCHLFMIKLRKKHVN